MKMTYIYSLIASRVAKLFLPYYLLLPLFMSVFLSLNILYEVLR